MDGLSCGPHVSLEKEVRIDNIACTGYRYFIFKLSPSCSTLYRIVARICDGGLARICDRVSSRFAHAHTFRTCKQTESGEFVVGECKCIEIHV